MSNNTVLDFVTQFMPERLKYWNRLDYVMTLKLARQKITSEECEHLVLYPEEAGSFDFCFEAMKKNIADVQFILENADAAGDVLFWKQVSNFYPTGKYSRQYDFIFQNPDQYKKDLRNCKTINGCFRKLKDFIPGRYFETQLEGKDFFGEFTVQLDTVHFESRFETVNFSHDEVYLIPYFIEYRNMHLLEWIYEDMAYKKGKEGLPIQEINGRLQQTALASRVQAETVIAGRIRQLLHDKGYFDGINVEWNHDYADQLILVSYVKKNAAFNTRVTTVLRTFRLEDDITRLEASL